MLKPPKDLSVEAQRLWTATTKDYDLAEHALALLLKACRTHDIVEQLEAIVDEEGAVITSPRGSKAHPALVEARQQRLTFARLIAALRIPDDDTGTRKQSRSIRGIYQVGA